MKLLFKQILTVALIAGLAFYSSSFSVNAGCRTITAAKAGVTPKSNYKCAPDWLLEELEKQQTERLQEDGDVRIEPNEDLSPAQKVILKLENWRLKNQTSKIARHEAAAQIMAAFNYQIKQNLIDKKTKPFPDVNQKTQNAAAIATAKKEDIIHGYADGKFRPKQNMTRAEATKIVLRASRLNRCLKTAPAVSFTDVEASAWYTPTLGKAQQLQIIHGYSLTEFKPNRSITTGELQVMTSRAVNILRLFNQAMGARDRAAQPADGNVLQESASDIPPMPHDWQCK